MNLADRSQSTSVEIELPVYCYQSAPLTEEILQSLVDDLRDAQEPLAA